MTALHQGDDTGARLLRLLRVDGGTARWLACALFISAEASAAAEHVPTEPRNTAKMDERAAKL